MSDEKRINYPKAFVVLQIGKSSSEEKKQEIILHCKDMLQEYMVPAEVKFFDDFPKTPRGKLDYRVLEEQSV